MLRLIIVLLLLVPTSLKASDAGFEVDPARTMLIQNEIRNLRKEIFDLALLGLENSKPIYLMIDTPGGYVEAGQEFIDAMAKLQSKGMKFECFAKRAQSMGLAIFNACDRRVISNDSELLWHPAKVHINGGLSAADAERFAKGLREADEQVWGPVRKKLNVSDEVWQQHYDAETNHTGKAFHELDPNYTEVVEKIENFEFKIFDPMDELLKQLFPEGLLLITPWYITPTE